MSLIIFSKKHFQINFSNLKKFKSELFCSFFKQKYFTRLMMFFAIKGKKEMNLFKFKNFSFLLKMFNCLHTTISQPITGFYSGFSYMPFFYDLTPS